MQFHADTIENLIRFAYQILLTANVKKEEDIISLICAQIPDQTMDLQTFDITHISAAEKRGIAASVLYEAAWRRSSVLRTVNETLRM